MNDEGQNAREEPHCLLTCVNNSRSTNESVRCDCRSLSDLITRERVEPDSGLSSCLLDLDDIQC